MKPSFRVLRRASQLIFLALTLLLLSLPLGPRLFMQASPLAALSASLASHAPVLAWGWLFLLLALPFGRFFCGWVCPLGTLNGLYGPRKPLAGRGLKLLLLFLLLFSAGMGLNLAGWFDPLSILTRAAATVSLVRGDPKQALWLLPLGGILLLNLFRRRFWCRILCPLGALLGVASSLWSKGKRENCSDCKLCTSQCPQGAAPPEGWLSPECVLCGSCVERCPKQALTLRGEPSVSLPKRQFLGALLLGTSLFLPWRKKDETLRPPGAGEDFLGKCVRCGACLKACPTHALQPSLFERGWEGLLTPRFSPRQGYCEPECTRCHEVCPTGAIKKRARIGLA
ncbi:MAG: 4Fe-4S binding protein, partial [Bacteroidota bacterium]